MALFGGKKIGDLVNKDKLGEALKNVKDAAANVAKETSESLKKSSEESKELKAPMEGAIVRYGVIYHGGLSQYNNVKHSGEIGLNIMPDSFSLNKTFTSKDWFDDISIPYSSVRKFELAKRQVTNADWLLSSSSSDMKAMEQENNIHITFDDDNGNEVLLRLEMLTGVSIYGQAVKCREMLDTLRQNGILKLLSKEEKAVVSQPTGNDIIDQIEKLSKLKESGILTEEEFNTKKAGLLEKL